MPKEVNLQIEKISLVGIIDNGLRRHLRFTNSSRLQFSGTLENQTAAIKLKETLKLAIIDSMQLLIEEKYNETP